MRSVMTHESRWNEEGFFKNFIAHAAFTVHYGKWGPTGDSSKKPKKSGLQKTKNQANYVLNDIPESQVP